MSKVIGEEQCPLCAAEGCDRSHNNVKCYEDGSKFCFKCWEQIGEVKIADFLPGEITQLNTRGITYDTCRFFNYEVGQDKFGEWVQLANYYNGKKRQIGQKVRYATDEETGRKKMFIIGDGKNLPLYGQWLWSSPNKLFITVVEGEIDALTVAQVMGLQYPVVSIPKGSGSAVESIKSNLQYLLGFSHVVLAFDNDEAGLEATNRCLKEFEPGKIRVATWTLKDANQMLLDGRHKEIKDCIYNAKDYVPREIVTVSDVIDKVLTQPIAGPKYPWPTWSVITYGLRLKNIIVIVAATATGKTELIKDIIFHVLDTTDYNVGLFSFEQDPEDSIQRLVGAKLGVKLHLPGASWDEKAIKEEATKFDQKIFFYDKAGNVDHTSLFNNIRYLARAKNVKLFFIDNIKALNIVNDTRDTTSFMNRLKSLIKELGVTVFLLSHVSKNTISRSTHVGFSSKVSNPHGNLTEDQIKTTMNKFHLDWEDGRMPGTSDVEGGGTITALSDYTFALARNRTSKNDMVKRTLKIKLIKSRLNSTYDGTTFELYYGDDGKLHELEKKLITNAGGF